MEIVRHSSDYDTKCILLRAVRRLLDSKSATKLARGLNMAPADTDYTSITIYSIAPSLCRSLSSEQS